MTVKSQPVHRCHGRRQRGGDCSRAEPGMQVVAAGVHVLQPGQKVTLSTQKKGLQPLSAVRKQLLMKFAGAK
jgi:multidrug efflux system membrane fusion protein